jgi:hypothetical protein
VHKLIFMAPQATIDVMRPHIEQQLSGKAAVTTALSGMLEVSWVLGLRSLWVGF